ncbi:MAG: transcription antitermination factor NusB [Bacilli bacterium]|jgi:N utilization substance protein B|nr:transcription antitermination factor NusB [Acholeplasmataceae bacterium]
MNRHDSRIIIVAALYNLEINYNLPEEVFKYLEFLVQESKDDETLKLDPFITETVIGILNNQTVIDEMITKNLVNWSLTGLSYVDRAIIRLATYEMLYTDTPASIIINEAIEITKDYSDLEDGTQARFNNRVLDNIKESIVNARK